MGNTSSRKKRRKSSSTISSSTSASHGKKKSTKHRHKTSGKSPSRVGSRSRANTKRPEARSAVGKKVFNFFYNALFYGVTLGIVVMSLMFTFSSKSSASIFGYRFYNVLTNSMVPQKGGPKGGFYAGDVVIVKVMDGSQVKKGDIVTFAVGNDGRYLTHRVAKRLDELNGKEGKYIVTKGDANKNNDPPIEEDKILGKVTFTLPKVGVILDFIREQFWACLVCTLSLFGFFLVLKAYLFSS